MADPARSPTDIEIVVRVTGRIEADSLDEGAERLFRELEPRLEVALGLLGVRAVRFSDEAIRRPLDT